jgi:sugar phosphate isomerase/epimerase
MPSNSFAASARIIQMPGPIATAIRGRSRGFRVLTARRAVNHSSKHPMAKELKKNGDSTPAGPVIRPAVTISLVPEARGGPFVFWDNLEAGCASAAELGFDAVEVFAPSAASLEKAKAGDVAASHGLKIAAIGTGAGWVTRQLTLTSPDPAIRKEAKRFVGEMIDWAATVGAPAIVGSMQGRGANREEALKLLAVALVELGARAADLGVPLVFEPLNRFETNLVNRLKDGRDLVESHEIRNVKLLADLFHANIEEESIGKAVAGLGPLLGHVHWADSNRRAMGFGHTGAGPVAAALRKIGYGGYISAEVLPLPDSKAAAAQTMKSFRRYFPR